MFKRVSWLIILLVMLLTAAVRPGVAHATQAVQPVVRAVLFWAEGCPHCEVVLRDTLPPLEKHYGPQLDVQKIEISDSAPYAFFRQLEEQYQVPIELRGVPALVVADHLLVGDRQIPDQFPSLIEKYLTAGGTGFPALPGLEQYVPAAASEPGSTLPGGKLAALKFASLNAPLVAGTNNGFALAWVIMAGMVVAIVYALVSTARAGSGATVWSGPAWLGYLVPILAVLGMGVAAYLTFVETQNVAAVCGPVGDCNSVQASPYARLFGFFPVGLLGLIGYIGILVAWFVGRSASSRLAGPARLAAFAMALFGVLFSIYLTYLELFVILAVCIWCLSSAVIITLLMLLTLPPALNEIAGDAYEDEEDPEGVVEA